MARRAELRRRASERTGRAVGGLSISYVDACGCTVPIDATTSLLDLKVKAVRLIVVPSFG